MENPSLLGVIILLAIPFVFLIMITFAVYVAYWMLKAAFSVSLRGGHLSKKLRTLATMAVVGASVVSSFYLLMTMDWFLTAHRGWLLFLTTPPIYIFVGASMVQFARNYIRDYGKKTDEDVSATNS